MDPVAGESLPETEAPVTDDFVHVPDPVIYSVHEGEGNSTSSAIDSEVSENPEPRSGAFVVSASGKEGGGNGDGGEQEMRGDLPEELSKSVVHLECESSDGGLCDVYLVGTAHVSEESCREVRAVINYLKPQVVFMELCAGRIAILNPPENFQVPTVREMIDSWKKKNSSAFGILYSWFLAKIASQLEVFPGAEFRVAYEEAVNYGAKVILGDRPVNITLLRTWGKMTLWHKAKFLYSMLFQGMFLPSAEDLNKMLKEIEDADMVTLLIQEMSKEFPTLMETIVHERDLYMSSKLLTVASKHSLVVAIVGKGHVPGIRKNWKQPIEMKDLLEIPPSSGLSTIKMLASVGVAVTGVAIISGIYVLGKR